MRSIVNTSRMKVTIRTDTKQKSAVRLALLQFFSFNNFGTPCIMCNSVNILNETR